MGANTFVLLPRTWCECLLIIVRRLKVLVCVDNVVCFRSQVTEVVSAIQTATTLINSLKNMSPKPGSW